MKTIINISYFFLLISQSIFPQWYQQTSGVNYPLYNVCFTDTINGTVVGYDFTWNLGAILRTTDGGQNWFSQSSGTDRPLYGVSFTDANTGTVVGSDGTILKTTDGGTNWINQTSGVNYALYDVSFTDKNNGTVVGYNGTILRTTDGGQNWLSQISGTYSELHGVSFTDSNNGTAVGYGIILRTTDGGQNWINKSSGITLGYSDVSFIDENIGTVVGEKILKTTDGGENWINQPSGMYNNLIGVSFTDANNGTAVGYWTNYDSLWISYGLILRTIDGGENWIIQYREIEQILLAVSFTDANNGTAIGNYNPSESGLILRTTNGGIMFVEEEKIDELRSTYFLSNNFPNPFNPSTKIIYSVLKTSNVIVKIFDILGNEIETLVNEEKTIGTYELTWYAENLPSGIYFYQIRAGDFIETKKMVLVR